MSAPSRKVDLLGLLPDGLALFLRGLGEMPYRSRQIMPWLHRGVGFDGMSDLPAALRGRLEELATAGTLTVEERETAPDGTSRFGLRTGDGHVVEAVLIPHRERTTVCVSSQVGCAYGCRFCATGTQGLTRDLAAGEIVEQVVRVQQAARPVRVTNVVFMGMGEPLANYDAVVRAVRLLNHPYGLNIAARHIAISTCGLPEGIRRLAGEGLQVALAISLHAATNEVRTPLVPINRTHPVASVVGAARDYAQRTGRKVAFQYVVEPGVNDARQQAERLAGLVRGWPAMVNVIPRNPTHDAGAPDARAAVRFAALLGKAGVPVAVRRSRGGEVLGACGQLRERRLGQQKARRAAARLARSRLDRDSG